MPRFALLEHDHPAPHFDLLLQAGEVLWAWRLEALPPADTAAAAERNFDHRLLYLDFEGPISAGRGQVRRLDGGELVWVEQSAESVIVEVRGRVIDGRLELTHVEGTRWRLTWWRGSGWKT